MPSCFPPPGPDPAPHLCPHDLSLVRPGNPAAAGRDSGQPPPPPPGASPPCGASPPGLRLGVPSTRLPTCRQVTLHPQGSHPARPRITPRTSEHCRGRAFSLSTGFHRPDTSSGSVTTLSFTLAITGPPLCTYPALGAPSAALQGRTAGRSTGVLLSTSSTVRLHPC